MDALRKIEPYTINDIYSLPEGIRAELINGQIYYQATPSTRHQRLISFFNIEIGMYIRRNKGECEVFPAPFAVFLDEDENYVEPDISVICDKDKLDDKGCHGAPDWIVEVVSLGSKSMDYFTKLFKYRSVGVREYWIVDPEKDRVIVYRFEKNKLEEYSFADEIPVGIYEDFSIKFQQ